MFARSGTVVVQRCTVQSCSANTGGAIKAFDRTTVTMQDVTVSDCVASSHGGAVHLSRSSSMHAVSTTMSSNTATLSGGSAAYVIDDSTLTLTRCQVSMNRGLAAAIDVSVGSTLALEETSVTDNEAPGSSTALLASLGLVNTLPGGIFCNDATLKGDALSTVASNAPYNVVCSFCTRTSLVGGAMATPGLSMAECPGQSAAITSLTTARAHPSDLIPTQGGIVTVTLSPAATTNSTPVVAYFAGQLVTAELDASLAQANVTIPPGLGIAQPLQVFVEGLMASSDNVLYVSYSPPSVTALVRTHMVNPIDGHPSPRTIPSHCVACFVLHQGSTVVPTTGGPLFIYGANFGPPELPWGYAGLGSGGGDSASVAGVACAEVQRLSHEALLCTVGSGVGTERPVVVEVGGQPQATSPLTITQADAPWATAMVSAAVADPSDVGQSPQSVALAYTVSNTGGVALRHYTIRYGVDVQSDTATPLTCANEAGIEHNTSTGATDAVVGPLLPGCWYAWKCGSTACMH